MIPTLSHAARALFLAALVGGAAPDGVRALLNRSSL